MWQRWLPLFICLLASILCTGHDYDLPALPDLEAVQLALKLLDGPYSNIFSSNLLVSTNASTNVNRIPPLFWLTMKSTPKDSRDLPEHIRHYLDLYKNWRSVIADDKYAHEFITKVYANTSFLWAYEALNPALGAAKADLWRYAVLYAVGGVYIDADAGFVGNLDSLISPKDEIILSVGRHRLHRCYKSTYHLDKSAESELYGNHVIIQWMLISAPYDPFLSRTIINIVEIIKSEYLGQSVLSPTISKAHMVSCTTGSHIFTNSVKQVIYSPTSVLHGYRLDGANYATLHGTFRSEGKDGPDHHSSILKEKNVTILHTYAV